MVRRYKAKFQALTDQETRGFVVQRRLETYKHDPNGLDQLKALTSFEA
jgi:hypothetical protein